MWLKKCIDWNKLTGLANAVYYWWLVPFCLIGSDQNIFRCVVFCCHRFWGFCVNFQLWTLHARSSHYNTSDWPGLIDPGLCSIQESWWKAAGSFSSLTSANSNEGFRCTAACDWLFLLGVTGYSLGGSIWLVQGEEKHKQKAIAVWLFKCSIFFGLCNAEILRTDCILLELMLYCYIFHWHVQRSLLANSGLKKL